MERKDVGRVWRQSIWDGEQSVQGALRTREREEEARPPQLRG